MADKTKRLKISKKAKAFLAAYAECGNITRAAELSNVARWNHYEWLKDPAYAAAFAEADQMATDRLEQEARRRAIEGVDEPVYYQGMRVGAVRKYSDALLIFLLKGANPEKYKDRVAQEHSGQLQHHHKHTHDLRKLSADELAQLEAILQKAGEGDAGPDTG